MNKQILIVTAAALIAVLAGPRPEWTNHRLFYSFNFLAIRRRSELIFFSIFPHKSAALTSTVDPTRTWAGAASTLCNDAQAPTAEMAVTPPSIKKSAPTTYAESSDAR
jgi:hypothetical protein